VRHASRPGATVAVVHLAVRNRWQTAVVTPDDTDAAPDSGPSVVLPWWQNPVNIVTMIVAIGLLAGMLGWLVGAARDEGVATSDADIGFLQDMRVHHEQAVDISTLYLDRPDIDAGLGTVARSIEFGQSIEIGLMVQLLRNMDAPTEGEEGQAMAWMGMPGPDSAMPGMASDDDIRRLADSSGTAADQLFVDLMVAHHEGGIDMMNDATQRAENSFVLGYSEAWAASQAEEINEVQGLLD